MGTNENYLVHVRAVVGVPVIRVSVRVISSKARLTVRWLMVQLLSWLVRARNWIRCGVATSWSISKTRLALIRLGACKAMIASTVSAGRPLGSPTLLLLVQRCLL